jgi:3-hydroxybutyryl-CoA dehydrogenase
LVSEHISSVAVLGMGTMGQGIAVAAASGGVEVRLHDQPAVLEGALDRVRGRADRWSSGHERDVSFGELLVCSRLADAVDGADLVIEAITEDLAVKRRVYQDLHGLVGGRSVLATNTSSIALADLASYAPNPTSFLATHFFNPAELVPGVEVAAAPTTDPDVVDRVCSFLGDIHKEPILVGAGAGFVANRLQLALFLEALAVVDEGQATPEEVDRVVRRTFGFRLPAYGPFAIADMAGLDIYAAILEVLEDAHGGRFATPETLGTLVASGRLGVKTGGGFRTYEAADGDSLVADRDARYRALLRAAESPRPA